MLKNFIIGEVVNVHGVKGALKVRPLTDHPVRFKKLDEVNIVLPERSPDKKTLSRVYKVTSVSVGIQFVMLSLEGINSRDVAERYRGAVIQVPREKAVELPKDSYFIGDLIGCRVIEHKECDGKIDDEGEELGIVADIMRTGSNDVYTVRNEQGNEILLPAIADVIRSVDIENGVIHVVLLPGLREIYVSD